MTTFFLQVLCVNCICARRRPSRLHCRGRVCRDIPSSTTTTTTSNQYYIGITIKNVVLNGIIFATSSEPLKEMLTMNGRGGGGYGLCHLVPRPFSIITQSMDSEDNCNKTARNAYAPQYASKKRFIAQNIPTHL